LWAREHGLTPRASLAGILRAQIEEHRADVFYNIDATGWPANFVKSLPGCVKCVIGWHALPFQTVSFAGYDLMVCNFPSTLAELRIGWFLPLAEHRRPAAVREVATDPIFGRDYYEVLSSAKIVLNGSIDMPSSDRGNMRCFEALGSGSLLLSDHGNYPQGMNN